MFLQLIYEICMGYGTIGKVLIMNDIDSNNITRIFLLFCTPQRKVMNIHLICLHSGNEVAQFPKMLDVKIVHRSGEHCIT